MSHAPVSAPARDQRHIRRRIEAVAGLLGLGIALLAIRAVDLQWLQADELAAKAEKQRYRQYTALAPRGNITDARGRILAESVEVPSIAAMADEVPEGEIPRLAGALGMSPSRLSARLKGRKGFVWLARQVTPATAEKVMALNIPGIRRETEWRRYHPLGPETGHLLGFVGIDGHGLEGIERAFDRQLAGEPGIRQVRRDARGHSLPGGVWLREPTPGRSLKLTIDATIQSIAYAALADGIRRQQARGGSVVVLRPEDGAVLAMVSWPGFNPNDFRSFQPSEWRNRAITDVFEPGSTLKPFTVAAALKSGHWQPDSRIFCENGAMQVADHVIHDDHAEGWLDLTGLLAKSSNIGAAKLALDIGVQPLYTMLRDVGFGQRTRIGLSGESPGIVLPAERWGPVETANIAFGQGIAVTPLQLATAFSVLANDGVLIRPRIIDDAPKAHARQRRVLPASIARQVRRMLEYATSPDGTGHKAVPAGYRVAGKTGTAQKPDRYGSYNSDRFTAVFAGMAPADRPRLVIAVVVDEPQKSIYGGQVAAPIFRNIAANALPYLGIPATSESPASEDGWQTMRIADVADAVPGQDAIGMSLREVRRLAAARGWKLKVHGSGWVVRQHPLQLLGLEEGDLLEVWLDD